MEAGGLLPPPSSALWTRPCRGPPCPAQPPLRPLTPELSSSPSSAQRWLTGPATGCPSGHTVTTAAHSWRRGVPGDPAAPRD